MDELEFIPRPRLKQLRYKLRSLGLNSRIRVEIDQLEECLRDIMMAIVVVMAHNDDDGEFYDMLVDLGILCSLRHKELSLIHGSLLKTPRPIRVRVSFDSFSESDYWSFFRFQKRDMMEVYNLLAFERSSNNEGLIVLDNGSTYEPVHLFLMGIMKMAFPKRLVDLEIYFGRDNSQNSRALLYFDGWLWNHWGFLLGDAALTYWSAFFEFFADVVEKKMESTRPNLFTNGERNIVGLFIDNTIIRTARPGGGPRHAGAGAARHGEDIQGAFYQGWIHAHGLKYQSVDCPFGMCVHLFGPISCRLSDLTNLQRSGINDKLATCQMGRERQVVTFGDGIYVGMSHVRSTVAQVRPDPYREIRQALKSMRVTKEWNFGNIRQEFAGFQWVDMMKILGHRNISILFPNATILENIRICLYGCETCEYFGTIPPSLVSYLSLDASKYLQ